MKHRCTKLMVLLSAACVFSNLAIGANTTLFTNETPEASYWDGPYELGMKWTSSQAGELTKMRFYRALTEPEDGAEFYLHMGHIWDEEGNLLATVPFAGATGTTGDGWETVSLFQPLPIEAGKTYVASVNVLSDYVATEEGLASPVTNGPLSSVADGNNGVYSLTPGTFPTSSHKNNNYFVDVEVVYADVQPADVQPATATVYTTETPAASYSDGPYELGMKWTSSQAGEISKMRFWRAPNEPVDGGEFYVHTGHIWDDQGEALRTVHFAGALNPVGEGWSTVGLYPPLPIEAGKTYVASVNVLIDYVATNEGLASPVTNGPLSSIADGNNGVYSLTPGTFPTSSYKNTNYFVDVEVVVVDP